MTYTKASLFLAAVAFSILVGCTSPLPPSEENTNPGKVIPSISPDRSGELPPMPPGFYQSQCTGDADCIAVPDICCTCRAGGRQKAVPLSQSATIKEQALQVCKGIVCAQVISNHPSCFKKPACQEGICVLQ